ncbi:unnamed protein product [Microthlaspi erraticum]|uniref:Uncharacterized protein n=1 Tax=Microthlaspi erraticum TaxID=1685480 RepID=A0A6D2HYM8_9BRAS|nr:unnamed protein product [Microthlaspi erraticum]
MISRKTARENGSVDSHISQPLHSSTPCMLDFIQNSSNSQFALIGGVPWRELVSMARKCYRVFVLLQGTTISSIDSGSILHHHFPFSVL